MILFNVVDTGYGKGDVIVPYNIGDILLLLKFGVKIHFN